MKHTSKKLWSILLSLALMLSLVPAFSLTAKAAPVTTSYTLEIPATLTVSNVGWNAIGNISATGTLEDGKKLTVTATSANDWNLKKDASNQVSYTLNNANGDAAGDAATSWDFTELSSTAATKAIGIVVSDYSSKPAGTYQDTVTFTAAVEDNLVSFTIKRVGGSAGNYTDGNYKVAPGTTWRQFIQSGNAPACVTMDTANGKVWHDYNNVLHDCGGTYIANTADKKRVKLDDAIIDGATYGCSDYFGYQDHD